MTRQEYAAKRLDPRWQKRRLEIFERDGWRCTACESETNTLNVHHRYYVSGREPWNYPDWSLVTLCNGCHEEEGYYTAKGCLQDFERLVSRIGGDHPKGVSIISMHLNRISKGVGLVPLRQLVCKLGKSAFRRMNTVKHGR